MFRVKLILCIFFILPVWVIPAFGSELNLALADSTCSVMKEVGNVFSRETDIVLNYTCKSSGMLAGGMKAGITKVDFFLSASKKWMDKVVAHGLVNQNQVQPFLSNGLVVVSVRDSLLSLNTLADLVSPQVTKIIIGDPSRAPFGRYAKQALVKAELWDAVKSKIVSRKKISLVVEDLRTEGVGTVAILYRTELTDFMRLQVTIPPILTERISYSYAPLESAEENEVMEKFISFLHTTTAGEIFKAAGYNLLPLQL